MSKKKNPELDAKYLAEILVKARYIDKKSFYINSFIRGVLVGAGGVIGATVLIAILLWVLSLFDTVPLIGPIIDNARETIQQQR
ncbi:MAG TPA: DUF5665 domain-containing protein [Candidatus Saccharimonadales bacterium]|nr:DUF5665 domain-containing protein [Candidatus Saccharimonadales bacterium]